MKRLIRVFLIMQPLCTLAQSVNAPLDGDYYHRLDRYEAKWGYVTPALFTSVKPYKRGAIVGFFDSLQLHNRLFSSRSDRFNYNYIRNDNWEWSGAATSNSKKPLFKYLYRKKSDFLHCEKPAFDLHVNPVIYLGVGFDSRLSFPTYINSRGVEIRGMINRKIGFYTFFTDNQSVLPSYVSDFLKKNPVIPHEGFWKRYKDNGVDFFQASGYIDFGIGKYIHVQLGNDRTFIGNGYRSLILSAHSPPSFFFRTNLKVWKLNYLFQLNYLTADVLGTAGGTLGSTTYPGKFMALHHASINIGKRFNIGAFEAVIFHRDSAAGGSFNLGYLNPVIFYRAIEQQFGSPDNVIIGMDFKWNATRGISFYGQFIIDEFVLKEALGSKGWWGNKFGVQVGVKYIDVANIRNLDFQLEGNVVRPYTYSHNTRYGSYSHYRQPLAHPLGANFYELVGIVRYQPMPKINFSLKAFYAKIGRDVTGFNWGSDILKRNTTRERDFNNSTGQGLANELYFVDFAASYMIKHNFYIDFEQVIRVSKGATSLYHTTTYTSAVALRWNISRRVYDF